jgi:pectinesterase
MRQARNITAANTPATQAYGYLFRGARLPDNGATPYYLGRPWQNAARFSEAAGTLAHNKVVFLHARLGPQVLPAGWAAWDAGTDVTKITNAEYNSCDFAGRPVATGQRVGWSRQLAPADTVAYTLATLFGPGTGTASPTGQPVAAAWSPTALGPEFGTFRAPDIAVANLQATAGPGQVSLHWNISWAMAGITYEVQRSPDNVHFTSVSRQTARTDAQYTFAATDARPAPGPPCYYRVMATKKGLAAHTTPSVLAGPPARP